VIRPRSTRGLTLLEVVFASAILSFVLLAVFSAMSMVQRSDALTRERQAASEEAFKMLDTMLALDPETTGAGMALPFDVPVHGGGSTVANLKPADPYPTDPWDWAGAAAPSPVTMAGIAVAKSGVSLEDGETANADAVNLIEVRVTVCWRPADWKVGDKDQRIDLVSRRVK
jgi:type II secretory pathway pseudopilin PulG